MPLISKQSENKDKCEEKKDMVHLLNTTDYITYNRLFRFLVSRLLLLKCCLLIVN